MQSKFSRKPAIAGVNKLNAENNILCKLNILEAWAKNGIPIANSIDSSVGKKQTSLEYFPKSARQFNFWDGSQNSLSLQEVIPSITRNANETLNAHKGLRLRVTTVIDALVLRSISQSNQAKPLKIKKLTDNLVLEQKLREVAETELVLLRESVRLMQRKVSESRSASDSIELEFKRLVKSLENELKEANQEIANLKAQLAKVVPLKKV